MIQMATQELGVGLLILIYAAVTHWEPMLASLDMMIGDFNED